MDGFDRFAFVMVRPKSPGNIGATARAMKNMGFADLRLVAPQRHDATRAAAMAVHAADILEQARTYPDLEAALADRTLVVGTTARRGLYRSEARTLRDAAADLAACAAANQIAMLFGPEDFGLTNEDLKHCQRLITIPASPAYASLNLAQAVLLVAYELRLALQHPGDLPTTVQLAGANEVEAMFQRLTSALLAIGFLPAENPDHLMMTLRAMLGRGGIRPRELDILSGIARQVQWVADGGYETLAAKRRRGQKLR
ncbi:MAG TPA: RNA methyltransferase [Candidatus Binataceae bacterium]|nr:RNA methyltransferase [Candidatus Binataceae bacterium]